ncbi:MAG TPA: carboxypeptidase regulatory-like domain-containing protein [Cyclobacteriaceae bacterium]|nr:carboxypeptidase regulatory-like domain-containing protein [Cyclobacteriaceae bacterium]
MKRYYLLIIFSLTGFTLAKGQSTNITTLFQSNFRKAEIYYHQLWFENAIELYQRVLEKDSMHLDSKLRIADSYRNLNKPAEAEPWYQSVFKQIQFPGEIDAVHYYHYAQILSMNKKYAEAGIWYKKYSVLEPADSRARKKLDFLQNIEYYLRDSTLFDISLAPFNSEHSEFGETFYNSGIVFISSRESQPFIKMSSGAAISEEESMLDLFYVNLDSGGNFETPVTFNRELNTRYHEGPLSFFKNGQKAIITRNSFEEGKRVESTDEKVKVMMYTAEMDENKTWKKISPFPHNNPEYSNGHPCLAYGDQALYFSSDMPGGIGESDIYVCYWEGSKWGKPVNLGPDVNTEGDELFPFISGDSTLFFSSDGLGGFGGMDIFSAKGNGNRFNNVRNLGYPVNSNRDDISFIIEDNGRDGYYSSNRTGGPGSDDIYKFRANYFSIAGKILQMGEIIPVGNAEVIIRDDKNTLEKIVRSDNEGNFNADVPFDSHFVITAVKSGYTTLNEQYYSTFERKIGIDTINLHIWKHDLFSRGIIYDNETQAPLAFATVHLLNKNDLSVDSVITDETGFYSFLIFPQQEYRIYISKESYLPDSLEINSHSLIKGNITNDFVLEKVFIHKLAIFFDFNKIEIKPDQIGPLEYMSKVMRRHSKAYLLIGAHADARGTFEYNLSLSESRAKSAKDFLVSQNIIGDRIITRGFGEALLINRCVDGVNCEEIEHSQNRRADLKVVMTLPEDTSQLEF